MQRFPVKLRVLCRFLLGLFLLIILYFNFGINVQKFNIFYLTLATLSYFILNLILSFRIWKILHWIGYENCRFSDILISHLGGMIIGDFTPGRSGYLTVPVFMKNVSKISAKAGFATILVSQAFEFIVKIIGALFAILLIFTGSGELVLAFLIAALFTSSISILLLNPRIFAKATKVHIVNKLLKKFEIGLDEFIDYLTRVRSYYAFILAVTILGWFVTAFQWYLVGLALNISLNFLFFLFLQPLITLLMFIPITPAGLGLMESGNIAVFTLIGLNSSKALTYAIGVRLTTIVADSGGIFSILRLKYFSK